MVNPVERKRLRIEVTEEDIAKALRNDSYKCVVAQAIARTVPDANHIEVDTQSIRFTSHGARLIYLTPWQAIGYVVAFDAGEEIEPFTFTLNEPMQARRKLRTEAGKDADKAAALERRTQKKRSDETPVEPRRSKKGRGDVTDPDPREAVKAAYAAAREAQPGPSSQVNDPSLRRPTPKVFKTKKRAYGHRILRINQVPVE